MTDHQEMEQLLASYALDALEGEEKERLESHLARCSDCQQMLAEDQATLERLARSVEQEEPPEQLKTRLLQRLGEQESQPVEGGSPQERLPAPKRKVLSGTTALLTSRWAPASAAMAVALFAVAWAISLQIQLQNAKDETEMVSQSVSAQRTALFWVASPADVSVNWAGKGEAPDAWGNLVFYQQDNQGLLMAVNLKPAPQGQAYQLWLLPADGQAQKAGVLRPDSFGWGHVVFKALAPMSQYKSLEVTIEPEQGSTSPGPRQVLRVDFQAK